MKLFTLAILVVMVFCGCESLSGYPGAVVDPVTGAHKLKDTAYHRSDWVSDINGQIRDELAGKTPPRVDLTWNAWWVELIARQRKYQVNPDFYIQYIIDARRKAGLPKLRFYKVKV